ncbi:unnamed protein product [Prunus armeniaca]
MERFCENRLVFHVFWQETRRLTAGNGWNVSAGLGGSGWYRCCGLCCEILREKERKLRQQEITFDAIHAC